MEMKKTDMYKEVPEAFHTRLCDTLEGLEEEKKKTFPARKYLVILAAAVLACTSLTVGAVEFFKWHEGASENFGTEKELEDKLTVQGAAIPEEDVVEADGLTFAALQAVKTDRYYYFLVSVTLPEGIGWNGDILFEDTRVSGEEAPGGCTANFVSEPDEEGKVLLEIDVFTQGETIESDSLKVQLVNLIQTEKTENVGTLVEGEWELSFTLPRDAETVVYESGKNLTVNGHEIWISRVEASPFQIRLYTEEQAGRHAVCYHYAALVGVQYQDGSVVEEVTRDFSMAGTINDAGEFAFGFALDSAVDAEKIAALIIQDGEDTVTFALDGDRGAAETAAGTDMGPDAGTEQESQEGKGAMLAEYLRANGGKDQIADLHMVYVRYGYVILTDGESLYLWDALCGDAQRLVSLADCGFSEQEGGEIAAAPGGNVMMIHPSADSEEVWLCFMDGAREVRADSADTFWPTPNYEEYRESFCRTEELLSGADERYSAESFRSQGEFYCLYSEDGTAENMELLPLGKGGQ